MNRIDVTYGEDMNKLTEYLKDKGIGSLSDFGDRVKEIHEYNLDAYAEENPTLEMAYRELIIDIIEENKNEKIWNTR